MTYTKLTNLCESTINDYDYELFIDSIIFIQDETNKHSSRYDYDAIEEALYHLQDILPEIIEEYQDYLDSSVMSREKKFYQKELDKLKSMLEDVNDLIKKVIEF